MPNDVTVNLGNAYIGSAYSPQVEITENATGHEIAITHASPTESGQLVTDEFFVPNYSGEEADREAAEAARAAAEAQRAAAEDARTAAEDARQSAESGRASAESARDAAETERASAESARAAAESARATAEQGRASAESARVSAEQARAAAETARESASATAVHNAEAATAAAVEATTAAQGATSAATTATTNANAATAAANTATANAQSATSAAQAATADAQAATTAAQDAADLATTAAETVTDAYFPMFTAGAADGIKGGGPTVDAAFLHRVTGGGQASDGPATIEVVRGNTVVWNQLMNTSPYWNDNANTSHAASDDVVTVTATSTTSFGVCKASSAIGGGKGLVVGHKYCGIVDVKPSVGFKAYFGLNSANVGTDYLAFGKEMTAGAWNRISGIATLTTLTNAGIRIGGGGLETLAAGDNFQMKNVMLFDLTTMFGAGNEPATVAEFKALYHGPYYEYDAGSLLSVNMEGVETVRFNQWDEQWEVGEISDQTGQNSPASGRIRAKNFIPCFANTSYYLQSSLSSNDLRLYYYDADKGYIGHTGWLTNGVITTPAGCRYMRFATGGTYGATYKGDICINLSDPARNGTYEPYRGQTRSIPATDLRSAGSVYDELRKNERIMRVGVVDLGTLTWVRNNTNTENVYRMSAADLTSQIGKPASNDVVASIECVKYDPVTATTTYRCTTGISVGTNGTLYVYDPAYNDADSAAAFKTAMSGVMLYYALATPTTTPIDPPLNMSYRAEQGGTETVLVPTGEMSAPVPMVVVYGSTPDGILDRSASLLAAQDGPTATANHAIGSYLTMGGTLYRVTTAIASGEAIVPGTNVTATTVMAEILSLIQ